MSFISNLNKQKQKAGMPGLLPPLRARQDQAARRAFFIITLAAGVLLSCSLQALLVRSWPIMSAYGLSDCSSAKSGDPTTGNLVSGRSSLALFWVTVPSA
jgi:ABC-type phosphate transport system permease subunit